MEVWKESASLIIVTKNNSKPYQLYDYDLLLLKRQKNTYWGGSYVFPGGIFEPADAHLKWHNLFENYGFNENSFKSLIPNALKRPKIFHKEENELIREISLRICAIRETFEECGILLCNKTSETNLTSKLSEHLSLSEKELKFWQNKVHNDANEFFNMCIILKCYPNIWALHEWGNWMTPPFMQLPKRFNVAFFFTNLQSIPNLEIECSEIEDLVWGPPNYLLNIFKRSLLPPQKNEISLISKYNKLDDLIKHALEKSIKGIKLSIFVKVNLLDGNAILLPEDSMYPKEIDFNNKNGMNRKTLTIKQFRDMSLKTHRIEFFHDPDNKDRLPAKL